MYPTILIVHSWVRWLVILAGVWAVIEASRGRARGRSSLLFTVALDVQLLLGGLLYGALSPVTRSALAAGGEVMKNPVWRFWVVEHPALMILAVVFGHVGRVAARRGRRALVWYVLALLAVLAAVPWPFLAHGRPLFRV
jgi:hypothetical protein